MCDGLYSKLFYPHTKQPVNREVHLPNISIKAIPKGFTNLHAPPPADRTDVEAPLLPPPDIAQGQPPDIAAQGQLTGHTDAIIAAPSSHSLMN